jgi:hypothetical protein
MSYRYYGQGIYILLDEPPGPVEVEIPSELIE